MKAGHSKLDGYNATLPAMRPPPRLPTVVAPLPPPPASLLCAHTYALLPTAEPTQIPAPQDCAQANRAADRPASARPPPPPSPCKRPHSTIPRPCPLPRPEHLSYLHPRTRFTQSHHSRPFIGSTPNTQYTHSYLSSTRFSSSLPVSPTCAAPVPTAPAASHLQKPPLPLALAPPPARLPIAPLFPPLLRLHIRFLRHRPWYLLPITPSPKPVVQLLVGNRHPQFLLTPGHRLSDRPKPSFRYRFP